MARNRDCVIAILAWPQLRGGHTCRDPIPRYFLVRVAGGRLELFRAVEYTVPIILPILTTWLIYYSLKGWENVLFELWNERVLINPKNPPVINIEVSLQSTGQTCTDVYNSCNYSNSDINQLNNRRWIRQTTGEPQISCLLRRKVPWTYQLTVDTRASIGQSVQRDMPIKLRRPTHQRVAIRVGALLWVILPQSDALLIACPARYSDILIFHRQRQRGLFDIFRRFDRIVCEERGVAGDWVQERPEQRGLLNQHNGCATN